MKKHLLILVTLGGAVACGGAQPQPNNPTTTSAHVEPAPKPAEPEPAPVAETPAPAETETPPEPPKKEIAAEACDGNWVCVSVSPKNKIDRRLTQLIGDPAYESTQSAMIDDARGPAKIELDGKSYEIALERTGGNQIVLKSGGQRTVLDKHKASDFTYVGIIATKGKDGSVLVDIKYMK